jgi:protease-4
MQLRPPARALRVAAALGLPLALCACIQVQLWGLPHPLEETVVQGTAGPKILLLEIDGVIAEDPPQREILGPEPDNLVSRVREELDRAREDSQVRAVLLRINSPGGTVTASDVIYHRLMSFKAKRGIPVIAQMMDMGTSGAYYVALAADEIVASPTTVTGSIGVIMYGVNLADLLAKIGVSNQTIKAGAHKDIGSPLRKMTPEEAQILQGVLDQMRSRFVDLVRERRPSFDGDPALIDGRVLTAPQALAGNLVDRIGYLDDAIAIARERAHIEKARVIMYRRPGEFAENIYSQPSLSGAMQLNLINLDLGGLLPGSPRFLYMWLPGAE